MNIREISQIYLWWTDIQFIYSKTCGEYSKFTKYIVYESNKKK